MCSVVLFSGEDEEEDRNDVAEAIERVALSNSPRSSTAG